MCAFVHNTPQAHFIDRAGPQRLPKAVVQNQLPLSEGTSFIWRWCVQHSVFQMSPSSLLPNVHTPQEVGLSILNTVMTFKMPTASRNTSHKFWGQTSAAGHTLTRQKQGSVFHCVLFIWMTNIFLSSNFPEWNRLDFDLCRISTLCQCYIKNCHGIQFSSPSDLFSLLYPRCCQTYICITPAETGPD